MEILINTLSPDEFLELYSSVGREPPCREQVVTAMKNSLAVFAVY